MIRATPVTLCGGSDTRLWRLSRTGLPKQFLCLTGKESLFQQAALHLANLGIGDMKVVFPLIVTGKDHRFLVSKQLREISVELGCTPSEPVGRNTAPALTLAAQAAMEGCAVPRHFRPTKVETLLSDPTKANQELGWAPEITIQQMCHKMVTSDLIEAQRHHLLKANGYYVVMNVE